MHILSFGCLTKHSAKRAELVQKFVPRSRVIIFRNEETRLTPLGPKLIFFRCFVLFWCFWYHLVALQNSVLNGLKWCKSSCHEVVSDFATNAPDPPYWTLTSCFGVFHTILVYLVPFGCLTKLGAKRARVVQKFVP